MTKKNKKKRNKPLLESDLSKVSGGIRFAPEPHAAAHPMVEKREPSRLRRRQTGVSRPVPTEASRGPRDVFEGSVGVGLGSHDEFARKIAANAHGEEASLRALYHQNSPESDRPETRHESYQETSKREDLSEAEKKGYYASFASEVLTQEARKAESNGDSVFSLTKKEAEQRAKDLKVPKPVERTEEGLKPARVETKEEGGYAHVAEGEQGSERIADFKPTNEFVMYKVGGNALPGATSPRYGYAEKLGKEGSYGESPAELKNAPRHEVPLHDDIDANLQDDPKFANADYESRKIMRGRASLKRSSNEARELLSEEEDLPRLVGLMTTDKKNFDKALKQAYADEFGFNAKSWFSGFRYRSHRSRVKKGKAEHLSPEFKQMLAAEALREKFPQLQGDMAGVTAESVVPHLVQEHATHALFEQFNKDVEDRGGEKIPSDKQALAIALSNNESLNSMINLLPNKLVNEVKKKALDLRWAEPKNKTEKS